MATVTSIVRTGSGTITFYNGGSVVATGTGVTSAIVSNDIVCTLQDNSTVTFPMDTFALMDNGNGVQYMCSPVGAPPSAAYTGRLSEVNDWINTNLPAPIESSGGVSFKQTLATSTLRL